MMTSAEKEMNILDISFNQDQGCFSIAHEQGFLVYNTNPIDLRVRRQLNSTNGSGSGIGHISMLHRTNYLALVGGGKAPKFPNNKVIIWDDLKRKASLSLNFMSPILNVLLSRIRIVVVLLNQVLVYEFSAPPRKIATYETIDNPHGLADISVHSLSFASSGSVGSLSNSDYSISSSEYSKCQILAFPGRTKGQIQLVDMSPEGQEKNSVSIIKAHKSSIRYLALNRSGTLVASASETGTLIRVHSTQSTALLFEFRRGIDRAVITSMRFSPNDSKLAVLSDKGTLHVFNISALSGNRSGDLVSDGDANPASANRQHVLKRLQLPIPIPNYFQSTWSFCSVNTNQYHSDTGASNDSGVIGWSGNDSIVIIWKLKKIWERFVIVDNLKTNYGVDQQGEGLALVNSASSAPSSSGYRLVRHSWKSLHILD